MEFERFQSEFQTLTGHQPMSWQWRLFRDYFARGQIPAAVDIPTGLGKTAVIALWLIAIRDGQRQPLRLVYVVDRRAVVDQATAFVEKTRNRLPESERFPISTLRGQFADNREWLDDPARPAIIVGTVDMVGSRLLFEGYGVSRKMRPYHAGLLGVDTLIVLDEAHLVPPFERLLEAIERSDQQLGPGGKERPGFLPRLHLLSLSATGRARHGDTFRLSDTDLDEPHLPQPLTRDRLDARKSLMIVDIEVGETEPKKQEKKPAEKLIEQLAEQAWKQPDEGRSALRCLVYCNSRDQAEKVQAALMQKLKSAGLGTLDEPADAVGLFRGARRGYERVAAAEQLATMGFLADTPVSPKSARFLVATSAGEVGVDLDADHMVCDLVAWERMVQRLGRVNRRGTGEARIIVIDPGPPPPNSPTPEAVHRSTRALLDTLPALTHGVDASPGALRRLKAEAEPSLLQQIAHATTPAPLHPALTRPLLDAWSLTSLREHTGRPEVAPWLRGWIQEEPQTVVLWRRFLPVRTPHLSTDRRWPGDVEAYFEAAPPHVTEQLETQTYRVVEWVVARLRKLSMRRHKADTPPDDQASAQIIAITLTSAGDFAQAYSPEDLETRDKKALIRELTGKTLILAADLGGCTTQGTLSVDADGPEWLADDRRSWSDDDHDPERHAIRWQVQVLDGDHEPAFDSNWRERFRFNCKASEEGDILGALVVYKWRDDAANEEDRSIGRNQTLTEHQAWASQHARDIGERLDLPEEYVKILVIAARLHDEGKKALRWQRAFRAPAGGEALAKTKGPLTPALLDGYRHEFGSLFHAASDPEFRQLAEEHQDLVLHVIAAHHGNARPTICARGCDEAPPSVLEARAREVALRFARLQRRWGPWGLAWWEALLRSADQKASKQNNGLDSSRETGDK